MPTGALPRLKASLVVGVIFWSVLALAGAHADKSASFLDTFEAIFRRRSQNDCTEVGSPCWIGSLAAKEDIQAEERAMATRRSQFAEAMRSADENLGKTLHGSLAAKEAIQAEEGAYRRLQFLNGISEAEERAMATTGRLQFPEEMRSAEEKLEETLHGIVNAEERAMATRRSQFAEAMWSADEKLGKTLHGDRLRKVASKTVINTAVDESARLDKNGGRRVGTAVDVLARPDINIRSVQEERMRQVWQEGSLTPGNRRQSGSESPPSPNTCDGAIAAKTRINRCVV